MILDNVCHSVSNDSKTCENRNPVSDFCLKKKKIMVPTGGTACKYADGNLYKIDFFRTPAF